MTLNKLTYAEQLQSKTHHTIIFGSPGYGKDMFGEGYITKAIGDFKVLDINSESRGEGMLYGFPQDNQFMQEQLNYWSNGILKPRKYKNEIIMFLGNNLKKLKQLPNNIKVCVFNEEWITNEDLKDFLAFNDTQIGLMDTIFEMRDDAHITLTELYEFLMKVSAPESKERKQLKEFGGSHYMTINTIKRRARSLLRSGLFWNDEQDMEGYFHYLDLEKSANDVNVITSYSRYLLDSDYANYICMNVLFKKFVEFIELREVHVPICFYVRELNDFYYMKDPAPYVIGIQHSIDKILRKGRFLGKAKIMFVGNTQLPTDIPRYLFNVFNKLIVFKTSVNEGKLLLSKATIPSNYLYKLSQLDVGWYMEIISGSFEYPIKALPTLHKKSEPDFDVFEHLGKIHGMKEYSSSSFLADT